MILKLYSVYDSKVENYSNPLCYKTRGEALREIIDLLKEGKHPFAVHPEDYTLFEVGCFDSSTGLFETTVPLSCGNLLEFVSAS